jgi:hypothetical protein
VASPSSTGLSRRALFGLGLARLGERVEPAAPPTDRAVSLAGVRARWAAADVPAAAEVWAAAAEAVVALAAPQAGETVLAHGGTFAAAARTGAEVVALGGSLAEPPVDEPADVLVSAFGLQRTPAGFAALGGMAARVRPGGRIAFCSWSSGAVLQLLREAGRVDPLPANLPPASTWGRDERIRQDLGRHADEAEITYATEVVVLREPSAGAMLALLVEAVPALGATVAAHGAPAQEAFARVLAPHLRDDDDHGVRLDVPCLVVAARRR